MDEKKTFMASLNPRSALLVGVITGVLVLGTVGFIVLGVITLRAKGGSSLLSSKGTTTTSATQQRTATPTVVKATKPKIELFIMSYCPYGLQMQKAYLPVMELLKGKADMDVKWVSYIMHEKKEIDENDRQYCIQKEQSDKYLAYAKCFTISGEYKSCLTSAKVDETKLTACIKAADSQFSTSKKYNDKSTWLSGYYPPYSVHEDLNKKYGVQGSPTLIINGQEAQVNRTAEAVKQAVCASFESEPAECKTTLSTAAASAGFGAGTGADTAGVECGS